MKATVSRFLALLMAGWLPLAAIPASAAATQSVRVTIRDYAFQPAEITVEPGTTVVWVNEDESPHTATDTKGSFDSKALDTGESFSLDFDKEGDYTYFCLLHPRMTGTVHVVHRP